MKRCYALSGVYDMRDFMDGMYDDNFYFHNPGRLHGQPDRSRGISDQLATCEIRLVTGTGPYEKSG